MADGVFKGRFADIDAQICAVRLAILVWGSGTTANEFYAKRCKIREVLRAQFPNSEVRFSEDPELRDLVPGMQ